MQHARRHEGTNNKHDELNKIHDRFSGWSAELAEGAHFLPTGEGWGVGKACGWGVMNYGEFCARVSWVNQEPNDQKYYSEYCDLPQDEK